MNGETVQLINQLERRISKIESQIVRPAGDIVSWSTAVGMALNFPGVVEVWQFGNYDKSSGQVYGLAQGRHLTRVNGVNFGWSGLIPFADLNGTNHYFSRADEAQLDMVSATSTQGIMTFGWFHIQRLATSEILISKASGATTNFNYYLHKASNDRIYANIWDGTTQHAAESSTTITTGWHHLGMIWNSSKIGVWLDGKETSITTSIPVASNNSTAAFVVGAFDGGSSPFDGLVPFIFLGQRTAETFMSTFYQMTRAQFE